MKNDKATQAFFLTMLWAVTAILSGYQFPLDRMFEPVIQFVPLLCFMLLWKQAKKNHRFTTQTGGSINSNYSPRFSCASVTAWNFTRVSRTSFKD